MFLNKRKNGFFYIHYFDANGNRKSVSTKCRTKAEASQRLSEFQSRLTSRIISTKSTFLELANTYLEYSKTNHAYGNTVRIQYAINRFTPFVQNLQLDKITPMIIENFKSERLKVVKPNTVNLELRSLKAMFNKAVEWDILGRCPFKGVKLLPIPEQKIKSISVGEFQKLLETVKLDWLRNLMIVAVNTGMRRSELINLHWEDIDFNNCTLIVRNRTGFNTKTKRERIISLNETVVDIFKKQARINESVFTYENGEVLNPQWVTHQFTYLVRNSGLSKRVTFHSLRHTTATELLKRNVPIVVVSKILGHSDIKTTMIYSWVNNDDQKMAVDKLNSFLEKGND